MRFVGATRLSHGSYTKDFDFLLWPVYCEGHWWLINEVFVWQKSLVSQHVCEFQYLRCMPTNYINGSKLTYWPYKRQWWQLRPSEGLLSNPTDQKAEMKNSVTFDVLLLSETEKLCLSKLMSKNKYGNNCG